MIQKHFPLLTKLAVIALLYPWVVSFSNPHDSLSHKITIIGGTGQYDVISRDCSGRVLSVTQVPFSDAAATIEGAIADGVGYKLRGGYISTSTGEHLFRSDWKYDSMGYTYPSWTPDGFYGGATLRLASNYFGLDLTGLLSNRHIEFSEFDNNYAIGGGLRIGYLNAWYWSFDMLNDDPIISHLWGATGLGFALNAADYEKRRQLPPTLWLGVGAGVFDGPMLLAKLSYPFSRQWSGDFSGTLSTAANFEGAVTAGVGYAW
jgi:hypothetical protein